MLRKSLPVKNAPIESRSLIVVIQIIISGALPMSNAKLDVAPGNTLLQRMLCVGSIDLSGAFSLYAFWQSLLFGFHVELPVHPFTVATLACKSHGLIFDAMPPPVLLFEVKI